MLSDDGNLRALSQTNGLVPASVQLAWTRQDEQEQSLFLGSRQRSADSMRKNLGFRQQKVSAFSELFRRSYRVSGWLASERIITTRLEGVVDRKQRPVLALVA